MISTIEIHPNSRIPKYKQLAFNISRGIKTQSLSKEERLPSINYLSTVLEVSRDTVEKAYRELRKKNLIEAIPGKGYFVKPSAGTDKLRIFLLFNKLSAHKKIIYDHFVATLGKEAEVDFHVYNNDFTIFEQLLSGHFDQYAYYVIIPHFYTNYHSAKDIINRIPKHKLILLDKRIAGISGHYAGVYQDFEQNIYDALCEAKHLLAKYDTIKLLFPNRTYQPREIIKGFQRFCIDYHFKGKLVPEIGKESLAAREAYITMMEDDLVCLVKKIKASRWQVGQEIGILSYNENPLKEVLLDGISVISTDFQRIGETAANLILNKQGGHVENPFRLILRNSL